MFGRELKGEPFLSLWDARSHAELRMLLDVAAEHALGFVAGVTADVDDAPPAALELLLLPLYRAGTSEARSIGTLAPLVKDHHLQLQSVSGLRLRAGVMSVPISRRALSRAISSCRPTRTCVTAWSSFPAVASNRSSDLPAVNVALTLRR